jgi:Tfp pilus assembly protein PilZ
MLQSRQGITEVQGAVQRVEGRLGELVQLVRQLQDRTVQAASAQGPSGMQRFDASIDFQSASNFYKWRPNANVVTEGGVFVATRRRPPNLGQEVILRVTLPGGAELEAKGVVEWSRPMDHDPQTIPGFGARFVDLPSYARQLVDHFIQRRAPIVFQA